MGLGGRGRAMSRGKHVGSRLHRRRHRGRQKGREKMSHIGLGGGGGHSMSHGKRASSRLHGGCHRGKPLNQTAAVVTYAAAAFATMEVRQPLVRFDSVLKSTAQLALGLQLDDPLVLERSWLPPRRGGLLLRQPLQAQLMWMMREGGSNQWAWGEKLAAKLEKELPDTADGNFWQVALHRQV